ncbi:glycosyltransferase [Elioraea thermophila]|uniref:glycosyltransferase n=1 Tax=Elioraea thermophila TaxID=2185104 RepID=UPI000DF19AA4|nr:glycosyltransferase [Elioraea thermophila]
MIEEKPSTELRALSIALVIRPFVGVIGGTERVLVTLANGLVAKGHRVTVLHWDEQDGPAGFPLAPEVSQVNLRRPTVRWWSYLGLDRIQYWRVRHPIQWYAHNAPFRRALVGWLQAHCPDVAIGFGPCANTPLLLAARQTGVPAVASIHFTPEIDYSEKDRRIPKYELKRRLGALRHAAATHVLLPEYADLFSADVTRKTIAIPNTVTPGITRAVGRVPRRPVVLGLGRLEPLKNFADLVEAWARIADHHPAWTVEIHGEGELRTELEGLIAAHRLQGSCRLPGWAPDVPSTLASATLFCLPSITEGFPLAALEALACGLPVVGYGDVPGLTAIVRHEENGLLVSRSEGPAGLAAALDRLIRDEDLRRRLSAAAPASVAGYSEEAFLTRWLDLIGRVVNHRRVPRPAVEEPLGPFER